MITEQDLNTLTSVFATKQEVQEISERLSRVENAVNSISMGVDQVLQRFDEHMVFEAQLDRHDRQIKTIAEAVDVKLPV